MSRSTTLWPSADDVSKETGHSIIYVRHQQKLISADGPLVARSHSAIAVL